MVTYRSILPGFPGNDSIHRTRAVRGRERLACLGCDGLMEGQIPQCRTAEMIRIESSS